MTDNLPPLMCSQGGVPYNKAHLDARAAEITRLQEALAAAEARAVMNDDALRRISALTPNAANAATAQDLHLTVRAIAEVSLAFTGASLPAILAETRKKALEEADNAIYALIEPDPIDMRAKHISEGLTLARDAIRSLLALQENSNG